MDVDAEAGQAAEARVCIEAMVPVWVPTDMINEGMNAMWKTKVGKKLNAALSKNVDLSSKEFVIKETKCTTSDSSSKLVDFSKTIPFIGAIAFRVYSEARIAGLSLVSDDEVEDLLQSKWGSKSKSKATTKVISMDMDAVAAGGAASGSICFQATVPKWVPTKLISSGLKTVVESEILTKVTEANPMLQIAPDADTPLVEEKGCDQKENPDTLLRWTLPEIPFVGKLGVAVYGSGIKTDLGKLMGGR